MDGKTLRACLSMTLTNYSKDYDEYLAILWKGLFGNLDGRLFREACMTVMAENKFFPNTKEILDAYALAKKAARERAKIGQKAIADKRAGAKCHMCESGYCFYVKNGHEYFARCVCPRGADLNRFTEPQFRRDARPEIDKRHYGSGSAMHERDRALLAKGRNPYYIPNVRERLGDDFALWEARKKDSAVSGKALIAEEKIKILRDLQEAQLAAESARFEEGAGLSYVDDAALPF